MNLPQKSYARNLVIFAYIGIGIISAFLFIKFLLPSVLPFLIAYIISMFLRPAIDKICFRTHLPKKTVAFFCVFFIFTVVFTLTFIFLAKTASELKELFSSLGGDIEGIVENIFGVAERLPFLSKFENEEVASKLQETITSLISGAVNSLCQKIPNVALAFVSSLPAALLFIITLILSSFYLGSDISSINAFIIKLLPQNAREKVLKSKGKLMCAAVKYVRAYFIILTITFIQLLVGFLILKIPYAVTLSALIALIDILPVLGVGTVLVPWAVVLLIIKDTYTALGLLIIFGVIWVIRQITEPKIVGQSVGLSPLITLFAMYCGFKLIGFAGLFLFPILAVIIKNVIDVTKN